MASDALKLWFSPVSWSDQIAADLRSIAAHDERDVSAFRRQVEAGEMQAMDILANGQRVGCLVWSLAHEPDGCDLVLNAVAARPVEGVSLAREVLWRWRAMARGLGARRLRCWTQRPGLVRILQQEGGIASYVVELEA
ncbi:hypothetical protein SAMN06297129_2447 [Pseudooceanicola antarcticus]|uniref:N-acetyltransferase domain-containing protein n=1 Tax=Pseudooceanicola antarcticus TaxID=1247613 RepID=A0A285J1C6_9RHOB|nr:hypothetical protein [Pseudooceanicola antarcticus]PJE25766.1 hypothetical protein CVM39_18855 [Pseudooceanicola antarcticus]SNY52941.1 hypothetical protein SAMN06297129_2447 [Pseudooceanicola antarcticus]